MFRVPHGHDTSATAPKLVSGHVIDMLRFPSPETEGITETAVGQPSIEQKNK